IHGPVICGLARTGREDIARCAEAIRPAERKRIHTFVSTSPLHMKYKLRMEPEAVLEMSTKAVEFARGFTDDVEWSAEDGSRPRRTSSAAASRPRSRLGRRRSTSPT